MSGGPFSYQSLTPYLRVADVARSLAFYLDALGFEVAATNDYRGETVWALLRAGPVSIMLSLWPARSLEHDDVDHDHPEWTGAAHVNPWPDISVATFLYVDDVEAAYRRILASGHETIDKPTDRPYGVREVLVRDPDGYFLVLAQRL